MLFHLFNLVTDLTRYRYGAYTARYPSVKRAGKFTCFAAGNDNVDVLVRRNLSSAYLGLVHLRR